MVRQHQRPAAIRKVNALSTIAPSIRRAVVVAATVLASAGLGIALAPSASAQMNPANDCSRLIAADNYAFSHWAMAPVGIARDLWYEEWVRDSNDATAAGCY
jgi:hypothetical protein